MYNYQTLVELFKSKKCVLLSTEEELKAMKLMNVKTPKVKYIASCGHNHEVFVNVFKSRDTGVICPSCVKIRDSKNQKENYKRTGINKISFEDEAIKYFKELLKEKFHIEKTNDCCLADMVLKPINITHDKWLMIQVKTTQKPNRDYSFGSHGQEYKDCLILCYCKSDNKIWFFNGNEMGGFKKITIGLYNSKHSSNLVEISKLDEKLMEYYNYMNLHSLDKINIPIAHHYQVEHEYRLIREKYCNFLNFKKPDESNQVYDFTIDNLKFQEKVSGHKRKDRKNGRSIIIAKSNSIVKKNTSKPYEKGDNDFYWIHIKDTDNFLVIPENYIIGKKNFYYNKELEDKWSPFLFDYKNVDKTRLINLIYQQIDK